MLPPCKNTCKKRCTDKFYWGSTRLHLQQLPNENLCEKGLNTSECDRKSPPKCPRKKQEPTLKGKEENFHWAKARINTLSVKLCFSNNRS